ncbi:sulfite reductase subunit alpha [Pseudoxanthomonas wuyuanensis]
MTHSASRFSPALLGNTVVLLLLLSLAIWLQRLNGGDWWLAPPTGSRWSGAAATLATYLGFCGWLLWRSRPGRFATAASAETPTQEATLVVYASQTGYAQQLAERTSASLREAGMPAVLRPIDRLDGATLANVGTALFIASTTGEGDPPDHAIGFVRRVMAKPASLQALRYAVLALGDRQYDAFCGFGHQLDSWLRQHGAQALFDIVEVDNADESALRHWQHHLGLLGGTTELPDWSPPRYQPWVLSRREHINPGSVGDAVFHLELRPPEGETVAWIAGDIAEIGPRNPPLAVQALLTALELPATARVTWAAQPETLQEVLSLCHLPAVDELRGLDAQAIADRLTPLPHREYSIASVPADAALHLLLRRMHRPDGTPGLGSGWLCQHAEIGRAIALRIRSNANFHPPEPQRPLVLIGNGTGIAGLRAHLKARIAAGAHRNWLLFGERNAQHDCFYRNDILQWRAEGHLERLDLAFSRDQPQRIYVQHLLAESAGVLRNWVDAGAAIYVCGSLKGMAPDVDAALRGALGDEQVERMLGNGRYRRDVY